MGKERKQSATRGQSVFCVGIRPYVVGIIIEDVFSMLPIFLVTNSHLALGQLKCGSDKQYALDLVGKKYHAKSFHNSHDESDKPTITQDVDLDLLVLNDDQGQHVRRPQKKKALP